MAIIHTHLHRRPQLRAVPARGWTKAKRQTFLDHLAAACNVTASAKAAGMKARGVHQLRQRDPAFAALWREALDAGYEVVEERLLCHALRGSDAAREDNPDDVDGTRAVVPQAPFDTHLAMAILAQRNRQYPDKRHGGGRPVYKQVSAEEVEQVLLRRLAAIEARLKREGRMAE